MWDGIIIGGGLAGLLAGIRASERGKHILIISEGVGSLTYSSGALDFGDAGQLLNQENHPYALLGETSIRAGMDYFQRLFPDYQGKWGVTQNLLTPLGSPRKASIVPYGQNAESLQDARRIVLMAPDGMKDFFPEIIKTNLERSYPQCVVEVYPFRVGAFESWHAIGKSVTGMEYAKYWQSGPGISELKRVLNCLTMIFDGEVSSKKNETAVLFPGIATAFSDPLKEILSETPFPVIEMTAFPPSASGHNLYCALKQKFKSLGGELLFGTGVQRIELQGKLCDKAIVKSKGRYTAFSARSFILATGGIFGGGIEVTPEAAQETVLGLPLYVPAELTNSEFLGEQPYAHMGIEVDSELRPTGPGNKEVLFENLRVIGRMLAHWDPWTDNCGGGVSLATGWFAGEKL
ncbi:MAG: anaerobic glycerol-3-phosphate dehydrogenase subunit B [Firmicutes bacterium HGW-Firmicutes-14]|nr:MAG: anaerobic glycerol-3-phosphate dehydrogenase subunit B [Firmicutes bacterium HGW-Firmicutes-14]